MSTADEVLPPDQTTEHAPGRPLTVRMWGHPWLNWTALVGMTGVLALMCGLSAGAAE